MTLPDGLFMQTWLLPLEDIPLTKNELSTSKRKYRITYRQTLTYKGRSKSSSPDTVNYEIRTSYFVTFEHRHLQLKCTWSSVSQTLWYRCRRIVVPGLPAGHLPCNTNTNGEYDGFRSSSKPAFWMAASAWADLWSDALSWLQVTSVFPKPKEFMKRHKIFWRRGRYLHGWKTKDNSSTTGSELWRNAGPSAFQLQVFYVEKWQNMMCVSRS